MTSAPRSKKATRAKGKFLCLIRHGSAVPKDVGLEDFERILSGKGQRECHITGYLLANQKIKFDQFISSPADRALETAHLVAEQLDYPIERIKVSPEVYKPNTLTRLLALLKKLEADVSTVALFGHDPSFSALAAQLIPGFTRELPKGAALGIHLPIKAWAELTSGIGRESFLIIPEKKAKTKSQTANKNH